MVVSTGGSLALPFGGGRANGQGEEGRGLFGGLDGNGWRRGFDGQEPTSRRSANIWGGKGERGQMD
jgi:hypothetical protein